MEITTKVKSKEAEVGKIIRFICGNHQLTYQLARPQTTPRFYLAAVEKNRDKAWDHCYIMDRKWWTRLVRNVDSVCRLRDKIWKWPGDEARLILVGFNHLVSVRIRHFFLKVLFLSSNAVA